MKNKLLIFLSCYFIALKSLSQSDETIFLQLVSDDSSAIRAFALYPQKVRTAILIDCAHPEIMVRMGELQKNTSNEFRNLLFAYSKDDQQKIWDLTRYPGLIDSLVTGGKRSKEEIKELVKNYPTDIGESALKYGRSDYALLTQVNNLNKKSESDFNSLVGSYPPAENAAFNDIINYPEAIELINSNMRTSVLLGDMYKKNPGMVEHKLDSLSAVVAEQNASELKDWENGLNTNQDAKKEYEESAREYANEQGYCNRDLIIDDPKIIVTYVCVPYRYWFGYPWWWESPRWYPYPYWYDWGFYYTPGGPVYFGLPSWYFTRWYFFNYPHHFNYPHFSDYCIGHYYGHRGSVSGSYRGMREWMFVNEPYLPHDFFNNDSKRPERLKEFGRFEMRYNRSGKQESRYDYLQKHASKYPSMRPVLTEKPRPHEPRTQQPQPQSRPQDPRDRTVRPNQYPPVRVPAPKPNPKATPAPQRQPQAPRRQPQPQPAPKEKVRVPRGKR